MDVLVVGLRGDRSATTPYDEVPALVPGDARAFLGWCYSASPNTRAMHHVAKIVQPTSITASAQPVTRKAGDTNETPASAVKPIHPMANHAETQTMQLSNSPRNGTPATFARTCDSSLDFASSHESP